MRISLIYTGDSAKFYLERIPLVRVADILITFIG